MTRSRQSGRRLSRPALALLGALTVVAACKAPKGNRENAPAPSLQPALPRTPGSAAPSPSALEPLLVTNHVAGQFVVQANAPLSLSTRAEIEARTPTGEWKAYSDLDGGRGFHLLESCSTTPSKCRTLGAGEQLNLAPWTGSSCSSQCAPACDTDRFHPGVHRLVLHGCDTPSRRYEGPPFDMAATARELWRWRAAAAIQRGRVFRLEPTVFDDNNQGPPKYIAGFGALKDSEQPLSPALIDELAAWLRARDGFLQYEAQKRCKQGHLVGLLLEVAAAQADARLVEISLNLACNVMFVRMADGRGRVTQASNFDPSWATVVSLVQRALPMDTELRTLHESPSNLKANFD
jgi:hypothetical protein